MANIHLRRGRRATDFACGGERDAIADVPRRCGRGRRHPPLGSNLSPSAPRSTRKGSGRGLTCCGAATRWGSFLRAVAGATCELPSIRGRGRHRTIGSGSASDPHSSRRRLRYPPPPRLIWADNLDPGAVALVRAMESESLRC